MIKILTESDRILAYRVALSTHISVLLDVYGSGATVEDVKQLILEHDGAIHPSECLGDLLMMFNPCEEDFSLFLPIRLELFSASLPRGPMSGRAVARCGAF
jgi:hypothetical protein